ncbi:aminopeptidase N-like [Patiria miniata]|uniref:Aminopeptidase n=1 Tax=Patiria miniata TaxID=46514 RepID=A0A914A744_PATMI|nr:aminopeptidase N-like [Patiria miniata]
MSDKKLDRERNDESGIYLHVSAIIFALVCVAVMVAAVGLLAGFLPDRTCQNESFPTKGPTYDVTTEGSNDPLTTTDPNTIWKDPRLPDTFVPLHYDLEMKTDLNNFVFDGKVTVTVLCMKATNLLVLNSNKLQIPHTGGVEILPESRGGIPSIIRVSVDEANQYLNVVFDNNLEENREYRVLVRWLAVTFFSPTNARMAFPCFDDPGLKANLTLTMIHPEDYTALGNMPAEGAPTSPDPDGFVTTRFATSPKISTYLVCFAVLDFPSIEITSKHNISIRGWARPDATDSLQYGLNMTARTLDFYIEHIGMDFPLPKIDVVAVPDFEASAMENWGLITYRETALLNTASTTSQRTTGSQGFTIAHEMGHQQDLFVIERVTTAMSTDALPNARPVQKDVATLADIAASFDRAITYKIDHVIDETNADWLLINPDRFGYYRVNYDSDNWQRLVNQLLSNHTVFSVSSRATLIDDSFTLARAGKLGYSVALEITRYLENEKDYVPWAASQGVMSYLDQLLITTGAYGSFIKYMRNQIRTLYKSFGWTDGESHLEIIPINQKQTVYCTAIATGRTEEFDFALRQYLNTTDAAQRSALLMSLACTRQSWQLNTLLYYTIDSAVTIKAQDVPATITAVAANPIGASLAWDFFRANYELFLDRFGDSLFHFGRIVQGVTKPFTSEFHLQELEKFIAEHPDQGTGAAAFAQAVEEIQSNVRWMESHYDEVKTWLDESVAT